MRLLLLTPQLPYPPQKGTTIRNFHLLRNLAARHELTLLSFAEGRCPSALDELRRYCAAVELVAVPRRSMGDRLRDLPFPARPDLVRRLRSAAFERHLWSLLGEQRFDLVQIEGLEMAPHWESAVRRSSRDDAPSVRLPRAILDDHNAEYVLQRRAYEIDRLRPAKWHAALYSWLQWQKLARYERQFCGMVAGVIAASELDRRALLALDKRLRVFVVPNGVDSAHYQPRHLAVGAPDGPRLIFTGTMDFRPNVDGVRWFCQRVWPAVASEVPDASFWIVGRAPKPEIVRLADGERVVVTGAVADVRPYLAAAAIAVVPLRIGGGSRLKVLEAMAAGVPVVSTTLGCEGIAVGPATAVLADDPDAMSRAIIDLLRDEARRRALAIAARALVEQTYDWRALVPLLDQVYREVLEQ